MKEDEADNITSIIENCMVELKNNNEEAYKLIIQRSKDGFFENHQSVGSLKSFAKEIFEASHKTGE